MVASKSQVARLSSDTLASLDALEIQIGGVKLKTYEQKVQHLLWFYSHYKNGNGGAE